MRQKDREEFIALMAKEGVSIEVSRAFLRAGATLHRLAELECSSEAADRDRVRCPGDAGIGSEGGRCLCRDYGSYRDTPGDIGHGTVPRIAVQEARITARVEKLAAKHGLGLISGGDPRGAVLIVKVPSGRSNDWGGRGLVAG